MVDAQAQSSAQGPPQTQAASAASAETLICTDRPSKANAPCTTPAGHVQIETDVLNWSRAFAGGGAAETTLFTNPTLKYGVSKHLDVELNWAPWDRVTSTMQGRTVTAASVGDLFARAKWAVIKDGAFSLSLLPYVKLPTAGPGVGNGRVEGGLIAPMSIGLPARFTLTLGPELDALENADRTGAHVNLIDVVDVSRAVGRWTFYGELWNDQDFDPARPTTQTTADVAAAYLATRTVQLDAGANFGLDRAAPQQQYYLGVSKRF